MKRRQDFLGRSALKQKFEKGKLPTAAAFEQLIDSMVNKIDDGFAKGEDYGLALGPEGEDQKLMSFFENIEDRKLAWKLSLSGDEGKKGLEFAAPPPENGRPGSSNNSAENVESRFFIRQDGNVGIGNSEPEVSLDVSGTVGMQARIGSIGVKKRLQIAKRVIGDGKWHPVVVLSSGDKEGEDDETIDKFNLYDFHAFEVVATIHKEIPGNKGKAKSAILRAIAMSCPGGDGKTIQKYQASSGWNFINNLQIRWKRNKNNIELQLSTRTNYGTDSSTQEFPPIKYHITRLWDSKVFTN